MKTILFFIDSLTCGGAEKSLISLLQLLDKKEVDVTLMLQKCGGTFETLVPEWVKIVDFNSVNNKSWWHRIRYQLAKWYYSLYIRILNPKCHLSEVRWHCQHWAFDKCKQHYDVAIAYQQGFPTFYIAEKIIATKKIAWINANVFDVGYNIDYCRPFYEKMTAVVAVSHKLFEILSERCSWMAAKIHCIYDVVNPLLINKMANESIEEQEQMILKTTIVTVGRLCQQKNHLLAVEAAEILKNRGVDFQWFFVGEGIMRSAIEQRIEHFGLQDRVFLLGLRDNPYPYIKMADIYVQTSTSEGFCLTIAEAKVLNKPIVSTDFEMIWDQLKNGENGIITQMTPQAVSDAIEKLITNSDLRNKLVDNLKREKNTTASTEISKVKNLLNI